jgi:hypothetical protein
VPEGRQLFGQLTVEENLTLGSFRLPELENRKELSGEIFERAPRTTNRRHDNSRSRFRRNSISPDPATVFLGSSITSDDGPIFPSRRREPEIDPDRVLNNLGGKAIA